MAESNYRLLVFAASNSVEPLSPVFSIRILEGSGDSEAFPAGLLASHGAHRVCADAHFVFSWDGCYKSYWSRAVVCNQCCSVVRASCSICPGHTNGFLDYCQTEWVGDSAPPPRCLRGISPLLWIRVSYRPALVLLEVGSDILSLASVYTDHAIGVVRHSNLQPSCFCVFLEDSRTAASPHKNSGHGGFLERNHPGPISSSKYRPGGNR